MGSVWGVLESVTRSADYTMKLRRELTALVGPDDASVLISNLSANWGSEEDSGLLASLLPARRITRLNAAAALTAE